MNYKITLKYNGSNFHGWAIQNEQRTIQQVIQEALTVFFTENIVINGSGRTDAKVHAIKQVFNFHNEKIVNLIELKKYLNHKLRYDIFIDEIEIVKEEFHARYDVKEKTYLYKINEDKNYDVFTSDYIYQYNREINIDKIKEIIDLFIGNKDFLSFSTTEVKNTVREIKKIEILKKEDSIEFYITGKGFLRNMVRMIIGSFLAFNENKITKEDINNLFINPQKGKSIYKAPGCGLYLFNVIY